MQFEDILGKISENTDAVIELLSEYGYDNIKQNQREIRFARGAGSGQNISMRLENNPACIVKDFVTNEANNVINFIISQRNETFRDVMKSVKRILRLDDTWEPEKKKKELFGGIYNGIINGETQIYQKTYPESILDGYLKIGNKSWIDDRIGLDIQKEFSICFDDKDNSIVIPWRNQFGEIIAIKNRVYSPISEGMNKYYFSTSGRISFSLYGYSENWMSIQNTDIFIGESEKFVMQGATKGYRNCISIGSNCISKQQAKLILWLNPTRIIWLLDEGLPKENTIKNVETLNQYCPMKRIKQYWWNWEDSLVVPSGSKMSPGDCSKEDFENIIKNELEEIVV